jgi:tetratricopeptide (TPR) repeat protein
VFSGQPEEAVVECDTAIRLNPRDPIIWAFYQNRAWARIFLRDYEGVVKDARRAIRHLAAAFHAQATLAPALALPGRREEAKIALDTLQEIKPDFKPDAILPAFSPVNPESLRPLFKTYFDGLRKAGLDIPDVPSATD